MEATAPAPPSAFLDQLPPTPTPCIVDGMLMEKGSSSPHLDNDLVLPYISRMLMEEEDFTDTFIYQQYDIDDPVLLEAQQCFVEIISNAAPARPCNSVDLSGRPLTTNTSAVVPYIATEGTVVEATVSMAFFKGIEEGNKFLPPMVVPTDRDRDRDRDRDSDVVVDGSSRKKRHESEPEAETGGDSRSNKQMAAPLPPESEEEAAAREMLERLILDGYRPSLAADTHELHHVAMAKDQETMMPWRPGRRRNGSAAGTKQHAVDMHTMLIRCAEAVSSNDRRAAAGLLQQIKHLSSPTGDGTQRLAHCFAKGLEARLAGTGSQIYLSLLAKSDSTVSLLYAYQLSMTSGCFLPVQLSFSNKTIHKAVAGRKKLHIIDYGLGYGFQWPDLLRSLSRREGGPPEVRLTGIDRPQPGFRPAQRIEETGRRLSAWARQFGVPFQFRSIASTSEAVHVEDLDIDPDEVLAVNSMVHLETLMDESIVVERPNPRDVVLGAISKMRPSVFVHTIANGSHSSSFFLARFRDALQSYSALFDMMDYVAPRDDHKRLLVEQDVFARCATNAIACEGVERVYRPQNYKQWQARNRRAGLRQLPLDPEIVQPLKDKVKKENHKCFVISEDQQWLLQAWKGRVLFAISTWTADDP